MSLADYLVVFAATFIAGFLNASVGGGGLLQVPVLMLVFPQAPLPTILGTAKLAGVPGLGAAVAQFARTLTPAWPLIIRVSLAAVPMSLLGARVAVVLDPALARPIVLFMLTAMTLHVIFQPRFGERAADRPPRLSGPAPWIIGIVLGFYEGFFGSGSGTVLIILFVSLCRLDLVAASVAAATVTFAGAAAALFYFILAGQVLLPLALFMTMFNIAGALTGARVITLRGNTAIRRMLGIALLALIAKLTFDTFGRMG